MKTLLLLRHAKSSWDDPELADFDRPLNSRGIRSAKFLGELIHERLIRADRVISSPAKRAKHTAVLVSQIGGLPEVVYDDRIYEASVIRLVGLIGEFDDGFDSILLIGHNPGIADLIRILTGESHEIPTAALSQINLSIEHWSEIAPECGKLEYVIRPKDLMPH